MNSAIPQQERTHDDAVLVAQLPSGTIIRKGDPCATIRWDTATGTVQSVTSYTITNIRKFPDGRIKVVMAMDSDPDQAIVEEDARFMIQDWWPAEGDSYEEYLEAVRRAAGFNN